MIIAIAAAGFTQDPVLEFTDAADVASAIAAFVGSYVPPKIPADFVGLAVGAIPEPIPDGGWYYDHATASLVAALGPVKIAKIDAIDTKTRDLISAGFPFAGMVFSLSASSQATLLGLDGLRNDPALVYPVNYNTLDDSGVFAIPDAATMHGFFLTAVGTVRTWLDSGTALKNQVRAAATVAEVDAIVDNR